VEQGSGSGQESGSGQDGGGSGEHRGRAKKRGPRAGVEVQEGGITKVKKEMNWSEEDMEKAVIECFGGKGTRKSARDNHVPYSTLRRRVKGEGGEERSSDSAPSAR
jgi:hypothetical protein